jgi:hypothetical protein
MAMNTMSTSTLLGAIAVVIVVVVAIGLIVRAQRRKRLKSRFGPEYRRAVEETGSATRAESKLEKLERRVEGFKIRALSPADRANFLAAWQKIQARFVDDPRGAVTEADKLIQAIMAARGYPVTDFEQRAADISVDHPLVVEHYRAGHDISIRHRQGLTNTEDLRQAMIHYRTLFTELAGEPELAHSITGRAARA